MTDSVGELFLRSNQLAQDEAFRKLVVEHCASLRDRPQPVRLNTRIHANDQMLRHSLLHHGEVGAALSQYYNVALQQFSAARQILKMLFDDRAGDVDVLDFACGYGRLLRFLSLVMAPDRLLASDIQKDAVDFVSEQFGVPGVYSDPDPRRFDPARTFDLIWVASLFSHLSPNLFVAWLERLVGLLKPGGVLCFSTHDVSLLPQETSVPESGIQFFSHSENAALDSSMYGTTFVTEAYVRRAIAAVAGSGAACFRIRRGLAQEQDLYVAAVDRQRSLDALRGFRWGPWGWVDERRVLESGEIHLKGWAASLDDGCIPAVDVTVAGKRFVCPTGSVREDVQRVFGDDRLRNAGWEFRLPPGGPVGGRFVVVSARTSSDERALLYAGRL